LEIPIDIPDQDVEVLVVMQPIQKLKKQENRGWPMDFLKEPLVFSMMPPGAGRTR
jgi:hypothetical protein